MFFSIKDREGLENMNELVSLQNQVKVVGLQDKVGEQKFHEHLKKVFEPVTGTSKITSKKLTKTLTESSKENNKALQNLKNKLLEILNDRGKTASNLMSLLSKITNLKNTTQFKLVKNSNSNRVNDLLIHISIPVSLQDNLLTFRDLGRVFKLKGDHLKTITNKNYYVDLASLSDKKLMYLFA